MNGKTTFRYCDIKDVYTIVLFEKSPKEFKAFKNDYVHYIQAKPDTGLALNLLQKYCFIPLDIFRDCIQYRNRKIESELDAWLLFLCSDRPEDIVQIVEEYPRFQAIYEDIYELCRNTEAVMELFSKELQILDENTVRYMIDVMQEEIDGKDRQLEASKTQIDELNAKIKELERQLQDKKNRE